MPLKVLVTDIETVPESIRDEYEKQDDGTFLLKVEDRDYKDKLNEFRANNRTLYSQKEELTKKVDQFKGVDPAKYVAALEAMKKVEGMEDAALIKEGKLDEVLKKRTETMKADYENQVKSKDQLISEKDSRLSTLETQYRDLKLNHEIISTIDTVGQPKKGAMPDIVARAKGEWSLDPKGNLVAKNPTDGTQVYGKNGEPLTVLEWSRNLIQNAAHLFEPGAGGGSTGGRRGVAERQEKGKMINPTPEQFGKNLEQIASGKLEVVRPGFQEAMADDD